MRLASSAPVGHIQQMPNGSSSQESSKLGHCHCHGTRRRRDEDEVSGGRGEMRDEKSGVSLLLVKSSFPPHGNKPALRP